MKHAGVLKPVIVGPQEGENLSVLGATVRFLCEGRDTAGAFSLMMNEVPFGAGPPPHRHDWAEAYYVVSGAIRFVIEQDEVLAEAGTFIYAPANTLHSFAGASPDTPAQMLVFDAPAHMGDFFRAVDQTVKDPSHYPMVPQLGAAHGIHFA